MNPAADWYPDPVDAGLLRYWSGTAWTGHTHAAAAPAAIAVALARPVAVAHAIPATPVMPSFLAEQPTGDVWLPAQMVEWGALPRVCVKHGRRAVAAPTVSNYSKTPLWVLPLLIFGLLVGLIVALALRVTVTGPWPMCAECQSKRARFVLWLRICLVTVPVSIALAILLHSPALMLICLAAALGALVFFSMSSWAEFTKASVDRSTHTVRIKRPARGFVAALPE
jgi:hypothetical protein